MQNRAGKDRRRVMHPMYLTLTASATTGSPIMRQLRSSQAAAWAIVATLLGSACRSSPGMAPVTADAQAVGAADVKSPPSDGNHAAAVPVGVQVLYDRGRQTPRIAIAVDGQQVFWNEQSTEGLFVRRAPIRGGGSVETVGWFYGDDLAASTMTVDADEVWWMRHNRLAHAPKNGGTAQEVLLDDEVGGWTGSLCDDGATMWVAAFGCTKFARVDKRSGSVSVLPGRPGRSLQYGGATGVTVTPTSVVCANGPNVVVLDKATGIARTLVADRAMASYVVAIDGKLYVSETLGATVTRGQLVEIALANGAARVLAPLGGAAGFLLHDPARNALYLHPGLELVTVTLDGTSSTALVHHSQRRGGGAMDERYVYWMLDHAVVRYEK